MAFGGNQRLKASDQESMENCSGQIGLVNDPHGEKVKGISWDNVTGPMGATIATLLQLGWTPSQPDKWLHSLGNQLLQVNYHHSGNHNLLKEVARCAEEQCWAEACLHYSGSGLEKAIPSLQAARSAWRKFLREDREADAKALEAAVCGGCWPGERELRPRRCFRCGAQETKWHRYWDCPLLAAHADSEVANPTGKMNASGPVGSYRADWGCILTMILQ